MAEDTVERQRLIFPGLAGLYQRFSPLSYGFMRFATGAVLFPHGVQKVFFLPIARFEVGIVDKGLPLPTALAYATYFAEFVAAACLALGLFTRIAAAIIWIEMTVVILVFNWSNGYFWTNRGFEYALLWWLLCVAIFFRGGGRFSLDRLIGREF
jgi:putative oxidoreductase